VLAIEVFHPIVTRAARAWVRKVTCANRLVVTHPRGPPSSRSFSSAGLAFGAHRSHDAGDVVSGDADLDTGAVP
jgi:hypothetical protein